MGAGGSDHSVPPTNMYLRQPLENVQLFALFALENLQLFDQMLSLRSRQGRTFQDSCSL